MKNLMILAVVLAPVAASASYGPDITASVLPEVHFSDLVRVSTTEDVKPGCTDPTPEQIVFACVINEIEGK